MGKYCSKCGTELQEGAKFCKKCGAAVAVVQKAASSTRTVEKRNKKPVIIGTIAAVVIIGIIVLISGMISNLRVPAYEKPLKAQVEGINNNDTKKYISSFIETERDGYDTEYLQELMKEVKSISYEVVSSEKMSSASVLNTGLTLGFATKDVEDALTLSVDFKVQGPNGEKKTMNADFDVVKINNKWYAITDMAD